MALTSALLCPTSPSASSASTSGPLAARASLVVGALHRVLNRLRPERQSPRGLDECRGGCGVRP